MSVSDDNAIWLGGLFSAIDAKDTEAFLAYLTNDALFRFGSAPAVHGANEIRAAVNSFFQSIKGSCHQLKNSLADGSTLVCEGVVQYRRLDDREISLPFTNVFEFAGDLISEYKIYIDITPVFAD